MANIVNQAQTRVSVDGQSAEQELSKLEVLAREYRDRMVEASKAGDKKAFDKASKALQGVNKEMRNIIRSSFDVNKVMNNLSTSGPNELKKALTQLNKELNSDKVARGSKEWDELQRKIRLVRGELEKISAENRIATSGWSKMSEGFNKYFGIATAFLASITGLSFAFQRLTADLAKMDDVYSDVMKTTGMTRDEVVTLNEELKKVDTRTAREELNKIAEEGGRIGIAKDEILEFVKAMDVSNVALGDSFQGGASEIANTLGKLKFLFKETQDMGVEKAYLSIGSAINELGANGVASEANIANFTTRMGSLPGALKPSIASTLALGAAFEESGIEAEIASRGYGIFISRASTKSAEFAKVMGITKKEVEDLINTNPLEFFLKFSEGMKDMSATEVSKTLSSLKVNADGVNKIIGAAASNTDRFRELIDLSNKSFADGTSVIKEFDTKNNNLAATLEKGKKAIGDATIYLAEKFSPAITDTAKGVASLARMLPSVIDFFIKYGRAIISFVVAIGTYIVAVKLITALTGKWTIITTLQYRALQAQNAIMIVLRGTLYALQVAYFTLTGQAAKARGAMLAFAAVTGMTNPLVILTAVIAALAAGIFILSRNSKEAVSTTKLLNDVQKDAQKSIVGEKTELELLLRVARNEKVSKEERLKAIKRLNEISPEYLGNLNLENINTQEATKSVEAYTLALLKNAKAKASQAKVDEIGAVIVDNLDEIKKIEDEIANIDPDRYANAIAIRRNSIRDLRASNEAETASINKRYAVCLMWWIRHNVQIQCRD